MSSWRWADLWMAIRRRGDARDGWGLVGKEVRVERQKRECSGGEEYAGER